VAHAPAAKYHTGLRAGDVGEYVLVPGDPARTEVLARGFEGAREIAFRREYRTFTGTVAGVAASACSTGIGGPSTAIAVEELSELGVHTFIRVGTCGGAQPGIRIGDLVIATGAVRSEGTPNAYAPLEYPALADHAVAAALRQAAEAAGARSHFGVIRSVDALYADIAPAALPRGPELAAEIELWRRAGVVANDMESATLFVVAGLKGLRAGTILLCVDELGQGEIPAVGPEHIERLGRVAVAALRLLVERDRG
jgi:uridine phosphorylase